MIKKLKSIIEDEKNNLNKYAMPFFIILMFVILNTLIIINLYTKNNEKKDVLRLHVVANSNSIEDQITKFKVANKIEEYIGSINNVSSKNDLIEKIKNNSQDMLNISNSTLNKNNVLYGSTLHVGKIKYSEKQNVTLDMEEGTYDSVRLVLGEGEGNNIWSLIFPDKQDMENIKELNTILPGIDNIYHEYDSLDEEQYPDPEYSLKIFEVIDKIKNWTKKN